MFRKLLPAALLLPLALACESSGSKSSNAANTASPTPAASPAAAAAPRIGPAPDALLSPSAGGIPTGVDRRYDTVYSYVDEVRGELSDGKTTLINQAMLLSKDESIIFWPIYNEYEAELFALGDQRVELLKKFARTQLDKSLDNATAKSLSDDWFKFESQRLELIRKYHDQIAKELSPLHAAQFTQVEHRVATVIDLLIASETPLIKSR